VVRARAALAVGIRIETASDVDFGPGFDADPFWIPSALRISAQRRRRASGVGGVKPA
jgi:hypothetical protein